MIKKSEVNTILGAGVLAAHSFKSMNALYPNTAPLKYLQIVCEVMCESLLMIDMGYSCTTEEMDAELHAHGTDSECPPEVKVALMARKILKQTLHLEGEERDKAMLELVGIERKKNHDHS